MRHAAALAAVVCLLSSTAAAERISLLDFEGKSARALRWRVAAALKRAGHTVLGVNPPSDPTDADMLQAYARRRRVDLFLGGTSSAGSDGWQLELTFRNADGEELGGSVTLEGASLGRLIREIKSEGPSRLDDAIQNGGRGAAGSAGGNDGAATPDFARAERARARKKRGGGASEPVEEPIDIDGEGSGDEPSESAESERDAWEATDSSPSDSAPEDDGRASFLSGDGEGGEDAVGVDDSEEASDDGAASDDPTVVLGVNAGFMRRTLTYSDDLYERLRAPNANAWVYRLQAAVFPFAKPVKNRIGLIAGYEAEFSGVVRDNRAGTDFGVTFSEIYGGLKLRQPLGRHEIGLEGTVGSMQAGLDDPEGQSGVPEFSYTSLRAALDVGLHFGDLSLRGSLGYRLPIGGFGEASEVAWFPRMEGYGTEGSVGFGYRISKEVAFEVSGALRRYLLQMNSQPEDALQGTSAVAGGAVDLYASGYFGLTITL